MPVAYSQSFDNLPNGDLDKDGFYKDAGDVYPQVQEAVKYAGAKGVEGHYTSGVYCAAQRDFSGTNNEDHWAKFALRSSDITELFPQVTIGKTSSLQASLVAFSGGYVKCYNGNGAGGGTWLSTGVAVSNNDFFVVKIKFDFAIRKWICWVSAAGGIGGMDTPKLTNLGFRFNAADSLNWLIFYLAHSSYPDAKYIDELWINTFDPDLYKNPISNKFHSVEESGGFLMP